MSGVRPEGCICEPCSDIPHNWRGMRSIADTPDLDEMAI